MAPTELPGYETYNITHVLEQIVRGYLCGSTNQKWSQHVFSYNKISNHPNVKTFFYRFEFQQRGTVHLHMLVWLKDIRHTQHQSFRADIPRSHPDLAFLVHKLQTSDAKSHCLNLQYENSFFCRENGKYVPHLKHPAEEFALNLRAYISTIIPALKCRMDFQTTDGVAMLLRYVISYVAKSQDATQIDSMYSYELQGRQAAVHYLMQNTPAEPETWFFLFPKKVAWSNSRTKRLVVPISETASDYQTLLKYWQRDTRYDSLSLIDWLRLFNCNPVHPKPYKHGSTLVGTKIVSIFNNEHFFQYLLLNLAHRNIETLKHPNHQHLPQYLQWYAAAAHHFPDTWTNGDNLKSLLIRQGNRDYYVSTVLGHIASLRDLFYLWQIQVVSAEQLNTPEIVDTNVTTLDNFQMAVMRHIDTAVSLRQQYYHTQNGTNRQRLFLQSIDSDIDSESESDSDDDCDADFFTVEPQETNTYLTGSMQSVNTNINWQQPILLVGKPGSGKSEAISHCVVKHIANQQNILVAVPTGFLASRFRAILPDDVTCDTVHSVFHIPVDTTQQSSINWSLAQYDILIIDEISMISERNFQHVINTLKRLLFRPVLVVCGDNSQQQPFEKTNVSTHTVASPLNNQAFVSSTYCYTLKGQLRVGDADYLAFLDHIRNWVPNYSILSGINEGRVLCPDGIVNYEKIMLAFQSNPNSVLLTFTNNAANNVNTMILSMLFKNSQPIGNCQLDSDTEMTSIYQGVRVITQNRDKKRNIVNGQMATIHTCHNATVILKLPNNKLVATHPVTFQSPDGQKTCYPFHVAYATTMCKAQGQTLEKAILWFDIDHVPPGTAYVALSRVRRLADIVFVTPLKTIFFKPVTLRD